MDIAGKLALVTGGTDGIGRELARQLRAAGAEVVIGGRDPAKLTAMRDIGFEAHSADLSTPDGVAALVAAVAGRPLALLVNNAGAGSSHEIGQPDTLASVDTTIWLNLNAPIHLTTHLLGQLQAQPEAMIVNVTSGLAIAPRAGGALYCATKAGLRSYTLALRHVLRATPVRVLEVLPPVVDTQMTSMRGGSKLPVADCCREIVAAIRADRTEANVGMTKWLRRIYSLSPALARRILINF